MVPHLERRTAANTTALRRFHASCLCRSPPPPIGRTAAGALGHPELDVYFGITAAKAKRWKRVQNVFLKAAGPSEPKTQYGQDGGADTSAR